MYVCVCVCVCVYTQFCFFLLSVTGNLGCFYLLAIVNNAAMNTGAQVFIWVPAFKLFEYISRSGNAGSYGSHTFNFLKNHHTVFHSGNMILHSYQKYTGVPIYPQPTNILFFIF